MKSSKLVFFLFLVSCSVIYKGEKKANQKPIYLSNIEAKTINLSDTLFVNNHDKYVVIYNSTNCKDCFKQIDKTLLEGKFKKNKVFVITTISRLDTYSTKYKKKLALEKIPSANNVFFELAQQEGLFEYTYPDTGIFRKYNIDVTPSILRYKDGKLEYFPYESIFKNGGYDDTWFSK